MKKIFTVIVYMINLVILSSFEPPSNIDPVNKTEPASSYTTNILNKWIELQIKLMSKTIANFNGPFVRIYSYSGLAGYQSILPGIQHNSPYLIPSIAFNNFPVMPGIQPGKKYHWPASLNAALAFMNRAMFPLTSPENKAAIDSLETVLKSSFNGEADAGSLERSADFGRLTAQKIFDWAETDGHKHANAPYNVPEGQGKWVPTPPNFIRPSTPYWGSLRTIVAGSLEKTEPPPPPVYSEDTASHFYKMIKQVYDVNQQLTPRQKEIVYFWQDINPGITAPGHWLSILSQVLKMEKDNARLDKATFAYALSGIALNDAWIGCWKTRYEYNLLRPVTFIRDIMGQRDWLPLITTPPHPEYTAGFAAMAGAISEALTYVFGDNYNITDHTYDYTGMKPRSFASFYEMAKEAADSKFFGGIHYKLSCDEGLKQGTAVAKNIEAFLQGKSKNNKPV